MATEEQPESSAEEEPEAPRRPTKPPSSSRRPTVGDILDHPELYPDEAERLAASAKKLGDGLVLPKTPDFGPLMGSLAKMKADLPSWVPPTIDFLDFPRTEEQILRAQHDTNRALKDLHQLQQQQLDVLSDLAKETGETSKLSFRVFVVSILALVVGIASLVVGIAAIVVALS